MDFRPLRFNEASYLEYQNLFRLCFPQANKFNRHYLEWLYQQNPDGDALGFDAYDGDRLAAHYACVPARAQVGGEEVSVLLSLNTATHPQYQGKGLFTRLAEMTYDRGTQVGYDCVYGVANAKSTPGFVNKLDFQSLGPLLARVGIGSPGIEFTRLGTPGLFRRIWSQEALAWRCSNPANPVIAQAGRGKTAFLAPALRAGRCLAIAELEPLDVSIDKTLPTLHLLRLFIGRIPAAASNHALYIDIPDRLRPSPLNLIYRSLSGRHRRQEMDAVFLSFLDFDAY